MNIPDKAVEAVLSQDQSWPEEYSGPAQRRLRAKVRLDLETAAPFIAAQALRDAAEDFAEADLGSDLPAHWLNDRADELDPQ